MLSKSITHKSKKTQGIEATVSLGDGWGWYSHMKGHISHQIRNGNISHQINNDRCMINPFQKYIKNTLLHMLICNS